jgi:hypothetical protein
VRGSQQQQGEENRGRSFASLTGPEDDCDPEVNSPGWLPDASDDPGDDEAEGDPVHAFDDDPASAEDLDGWPGEGAPDNTDDLT